MDQTNSIMQSVIISIAEKAIKNFEVELNIITDLGPARSFFIGDCPFGDKVRVATVSDESYLIAKTINVKFIFNHLDVNAQRRIIFSTNMKEQICPGVHKFMIAEKAGKYIL